MHAALTCIISANLFCTSQISATADERFPFPGQPGFSEALTSITVRQSEAKAALDICSRKYIARFVRSNSNVLVIIDEACSACPKERTNYNNAEARFFVFLNATNPSYHGEQERFIAKLRSSKTCEIDPGYATSMIKFKQEQEKDARAPALQLAMKMKLIPASECNDKYSSFFALTTNESPENIAKTAFSKCTDLFEDAAESRIDPSYTDGFRTSSIAAFVDEMRKGALERTIMTVVESRARRRLAPANPPEAKTFGKEESGAGI